MTRAPWANPSSSHADGKAAAETVSAAVRAVQRLVQGPVLFCSGGSEANRLALEGRTVLGSLLEHSSVHPYITAWVRVLPSGSIDLADLAAKIRPGVTVACQAVNSETGVIQPIDAVVALARNVGARVHCDAVQGWRMVPTGADTYALSAHKFRGPKGIGALVGHTDASRHGTLSPSLCAGLAAAVERIRPRPHNLAHLLRDRLELALSTMGGIVNGEAEPRVPHVTNVSFPGQRDLVAKLDARGISVSSGCACAKGAPSQLLTAMVGEERAASAVRCSLGETTTPDDVERAIRAFREVLSS
jgi:cysteine desulfurase